VESNGSSIASGATLKSARCVLFAYHEMGYACMEAILKMGTPIAALFTHRDDSHEEIWWRSCAELAAHQGVPVHADESVEAIAATIGALKPSIIYSFSYRHLIPESMLELAPHGAFNLHPSLLPAYRGRAPVNWVLVNGEHKTGVTLHHMVARADAGDIVGQRAVAIDDSDNALTLSHKLVPLGVELIDELHPKIVAGTAPRRKMDIAKGSYFGRRKPDDGRIDWRWPARRIFNLVRAVTHPYPGAFCFVGGHKLLVWEVKIGAENGPYGAPGKVVREMADDALEIAAGEGSVIVKVVQFEGGIEGIAREALSQSGCVKDTIQFD
jgi:UDP-4-amino-4-deoxy-L-arabinose formyltransferase/UDP-glucuronic acid dehydrogenase (UDP-4-keto-hexauronic acid decarboxylating)